MWGYYVSINDQRRNQGSHQARIGIACPHCGGPTKVRTSRGITPTYRQQELYCKDIDCSFVFGVELSITHAIRPSFRPNPAVELRMAPSRRWVSNDVGLSAANDDTRGPEVLRAANDLEGAPGEAVG